MEDLEILPVGVHFLLDPLLARLHCTSLVGVQIGAFLFHYFSKLCWQKLNLQVVLGGLKLLEPRMKQDQ